MVKLTAPLMSRQASGKLGHAIQFATTAGGCVAGQRRRPRQPRTEPQISARLFVAWISKQWTTLLEDEKASWAAAPIGADASPYHAYLAYNIGRFKNLPGKLTEADKQHVYPTTAWPAAENTARGSIGAYSAIPGVRKATIRIAFTAVNDNWLITVHHCDGSTTYPTYRNLRGIKVAETLGPHDIVIEDLEPGVQKFAWVNVSHTGKPVATYRQLTCTVTA